MMRRVALAMLLATSLSLAQAAVVMRNGDDLVSIPTAVTPKPPAAVSAALVQWDKLLSPAQSHSGKASNFTLVLHTAVLTAMPGRLLRLHGGFGQLQAQPVNAGLDFTLASLGESTRLYLIYLFGDSACARLPNLATPVAAMMTEALSRLARFAATGQP